MIGRSGERGSGISVLAARHDDDDIATNVLLVIFSSMKKKFHNHNFTFQFNEFTIFLNEFLKLSYMSFLHG